MVEAVSQAKDVLTGAIARAYPIGGGHSRSTISTALAGGRRGQMITVSIERSARDLDARQRGVSRRKVWRHPARRSWRQELASRSPRMARWCRAGSGATPGRRGRRRRLVKAVAGGAPTLDEGLPFEEPTPLVICRSSRFTRGFSSGPGALSPGSCRRRSRLRGRRWSPWRSERRALMGADPTPESSVDRFQPLPLAAEYGRGNEREAGRFMAELAREASNELGEAGGDRRRAALWPDVTGTVEATRISSKPASSSFPTRRPISSPRSASKTRVPPR